MTNAGSGSGDVFDVRKVRRFVELMKEHELSEIDLQQGDDRIRLRRGQAPVVTTPMAAAGPVATPAPGPVASPPAEAGSPGASGAAADEAGIDYITSPMVGTFYASANPESPAFVSVGDSVSADTTVCILEAMKVFNEVPAECSGTIVARLVENGDAIEFGQKLFKVKKA